jgi:hypothetical protein
VVWAPALPDSTAARLVIDARPDLSLPFDLAITLAAKALRFSVEPGAYAGHRLVSLSLCLRICQEVGSLTHGRGDGARLARGCLTNQAREGVRPLRLVADIGVGHASITRVVDESVEVLALVPKLLPERQGLPLDLRHPHSSPRTSRPAVRRWLERIDQNVIVTVFLAACPVLVAVLHLADAEHFLIALDCRPDLAHRIVSR